MKNRFFFVFALTICCIAILLTSCKLTISSFTAPSSANTGEVITLTIDGSEDGTSGECGLVLQIPANWEVISAVGIVHSSADIPYTLYEQTRYASLYTAPSGYKIWVGTADTSSSSQYSVTGTVKILTGRTPTGASGTSQNYNVKIAVGAFRNGAWVTDDPANVYDFSQITGDKYSKSISVTNVTDSVPPASVTPLIVKDYSTGTDVNLAWEVYNATSKTWDRYDEAAQKDVVKYRIYQSTANFTNVSGMAYVAETSAGTFSYDVSNLTPGTTYYFAVTATDEVPNENKTVSTVSVTPQRKVGGISGQSFYSDCTSSPCTNKGIAGAKITAQNNSLSNIRTTATSDSAGNYTFSNLPIGTYSITTEAYGYRTVSYAVTVVENQTVPNQSALIATQIGLSGNLAFGNVNVGSTATRTLTISNVGTSAITVSSVSAPAGFTWDWSKGTIPAGSSQNVIITFAPTAAKSYSDSASVSSSQPSDYNSIPISGLGIKSGTSFYTIPGSVKTSSGAGISGVTLTLSTGGTSTTDSSGNYSFSNIAAGSSGTVTPEMSGYTFTPTSQSFSNIAANQTLNFIGTPIPSGSSYTMTLVFGNSGTGNGQLSRPRGLASDNSGNIYVADTDNHRIQKFSNTGTFIAKFGTVGTGNGQFNRPYDVAIDNSGNIYVADFGNNRIQKLSSTGSYITQWGSLGTGDSQFSSPYSVATDSVGNVYAADTYNHRIQEFDSIGNFIAKFGTMGTGNGQFYMPFGITTDNSGNIFVADTGNNRIQKFGNTDMFIANWGDNTVFNSPTGVATDSTGNIFVTDKDNNRIKKFDSAGNLLATWGSYGSTDGHFISPWGILSDSSGNIYVSDTENNRIQKWSPTAATGVSKLSVTGITNPINLLTASNITVTAQDSGGSTVTSYTGKIHFTTTDTGAILPADYTFTAADTGTHTFTGGVKFATTGNQTVTAADTTTATVTGSQTVTVSSSGSSTYTVSGSVKTSGGTAISGVTLTFSNSGGTATTGTDGSYTKTVNSGWSGTVTPSKSGYTFTPANQSFSSISANQTLNFTGAASEAPPVYVMQFGTYGTGNGQLYWPHGVAVDSSGNIYVTDESNNRVQKFSSSGTYLSQFGTSGSGNGQFSMPAGIAIDSSGNIYVVDMSNNRVQKFSSSGTYLSQFGTSGSGNGQFSGPSGIAIDSSGNIYVSDYRNSRIQKFSTSGIYLSQFGSYGTGNQQFSGPVSIAIDSSGNIYVSDYGNSRVQKFSSSGTYVSQFGSYGTGNGQFNNPGGIAIDSSGNIYVADWTGNRIQKFSNSGIYLSQFGTSGTGNGQFNGPNLIAVDNSGNIYVPDTGNNRIQKFSPASSGFTISGSVKDSGSVAISGVTMTLSTGATATTDSSGNYSFSNIASGSSAALTPSKSGCTFTPASQTFSNMTGNQTQNFIGTCGGTSTRIISLSGDLAFGNVSVGTSATKILTVSNSGNAALTVSAISYPTGFTGNWSGGTIAAGASQTVTVTFAPTAVQAYGGTITVSSDKTGGTNTISVSGAGSSTQTENPPVYVMQFGTSGTGNGQFATPASIAIDSFGNIFVVDSGNKRIQKFNSAGVYQSQFGTSGSGNGQFQSPQDITVDSSGNIFVADYGNNRIQKFNSAGVYQSQFGTPGTGNGQFSGPWGIAIDSSGNIFVADAWNNRIQKFSSAGTYISQFGTLGTGNGQFNTPMGIAIDSFGNIFVADLYNSRIQKFSSAGVYQSQFGTPGTGNGQLNGPWNIAIDSSGNIFVADAWNNRIQKFDSTGNYLTQFGTTGSGNGQFKNPYGIAVDSSGNIWVGDGNNNRIQKFSPASSGFTIFGSVKDSGNVAISGVTMTLSTGATTTTDSSGSYSFSNIASGSSATLTPSKSGCTFTPASQTFSNMTGNQTQNFTGTCGGTSTRIINLSGDLAFGNVSVGTSATKTLTVSNSGNAALAVSSIAYPTGFTGNWSGGTIAAGASQNVTVTFTPTAVQSYGGTITVSSDKTGGTNTISVSGAGIAITGYTISGNICRPVVLMSGCTVISGVTMTLSTGATATTDSSGNYSFSNIAAGSSVTVTPSMSGYTFTPISKSYTNITANQTSQDYTASVVYSYISGYVRTSDGTAISHAVITANTGETAATDSSGKYTLAVGSGWSGTVTPSKSGYTFTPINKPYANVTADQADQNYTASAPSYTVAGNVCEPGGFFFTICSNISGVTMTLSTGGTTTTDSNGNYSFTVSPGWSGTVTPSKSGYNFTPANKSYTNIVANQHNQDYTASTSLIISGYVKTSSGAVISGVTMMLSTGGTTTTDSSGNYSFSNIAAGSSGTVTPSKSSYTFTPANQSFSSISSNQTLNFTGSPNAANFTLPDTGQTKCYNDSAEIACPSPGQDYYGQDGNYSINPPSYTKLDANGNVLADSATSWAMVKDNVTGLIWENKTVDGSIHDSGKTYNWDDAQNVFIAQLNASNFGGHNDWRLPAREELRSIVDISRNTPAINTGYFPNTQSSYYWSSSTYATGTSSAWSVNFNYGNDDFYFKSYTYYVRAVRGGISSAAFVDNGNGTITDTTTGLMWQQATGNNGVAMIWKAALAYCENLSLAGYTDWRLPNIRELASIADLSRYNPAINTGYFPDTKSDFYWSSSTYAGNTSYAWRVYFSSGNGNYSIKSSTYYVRAVRGGQAGVGNLSVSGSVKTSSGTAISGVTMILSTGRTATTDSSGNYSFSNIAAGSSGTITPSRSGYTFSPSNYSFSNVTSNQTKNFTGSQITYTVTFTAGSGGIITGTASQTVKYGDNTTAVTPKPNTGYQFVSWSTAGTGGYTPVTTNPLVLANVTSNMSFTANFRQIPVEITRTISLSGSLGFGDVNVGSSKPLTLTIGNTGKLPLTVSSIAYPKGFSGNWSGGTIAAGSSKAVSVTFSPTAIQTYSGTVTVNSDKTSGTNTMAISGKGIPIPISYTVSGYVKDPNNTAISGATLTFGNNGGTTTTGSTGYYSKNFSSAWTGAVAPSKSGYGASPVSRSYTSITANQTNQNFTLSQINPTNAFRIWIDKNGNGIYDSSEGVSGASVRVNNETIDRGTTDSQGVIQLQNISNDAKIYAQKLFYSMSNPKAVDANFANTRSKNPYYAGSVNGRMYDFVMASDIMTADGTYYDFPGQGKSLANVSKDSQGNMLIQLVHPKIGWNLVVSFEEAQSTAFYDKIKAGFKGYADYMYNYTDGYSVVKNVVLVKGAYINSAQWNYSDVQVRNEEWPNAHVFGNRSNWQSRISMGKYWYDDPNGYNWYSGLGHESGHYLFGFGDEYMNGDYTKGAKIKWTYRETHDGGSGEPNEFPKNYGLMDYPYDSHEMSDITDYYPRTYSSSMNPDLVTHQFLLRQGQSCWSFFKSYYQNDIKQQMAGQGFSDAFFNNLIIPPHTSGSYPNSDRTKRSGPTAMNRDSVNFIEWTLPGASMRDTISEDVFDAIAIVADETGNPVAGADIWLNSSDRKSFQGKSDINGIVKCGSLLIGKRLEAYSDGRKSEIMIDAVREVYVLNLSASRTDKRDNTSGMIVSAKPDGSNSKRLTITASGSSLSSTPLVTLSQSDGYAVNVVMNSAGSNQYSGIADCQYDSGIFEVGSGATQSVSPFEIFSTETGPASGYYAPNGELEMAYSPTSFTGTGSFVIVNSAMPAPANSGLIQVGNVYSFGFADTVTAVNNVILTIRLPSGINTSQMNLYGWNLQNKTWSLIPGGQSDPKYFSISIASLDYAAYALFTASLANSFVPPDPITGLAASAGTASSGITLQWTEPVSALAISAYDIRFNTVPVTDDNWNESRSLGNIPKPVAAGTVQSFTTEMPDPGIVYYFGIKAIDVAGNESSLTLSFPTKSQAADADGDGMPDVWEIAHGLDPNVNDAQNDDDNDGLTNLQEYQYYTDPKNSDTDGDGYSDGDEISQGTDPNDYTDYNDSPISPSCDKPDPVLKWGTMGTGDGQFKQPRGVATDASGNIYVADTDNNRIQKFGSTGNFIAKWGSAGTGNAQFARPYGIAIDSSGNIYVADTDNNRVQKLSSTGNYITSWGSFGIADGQFSSPSSIAADSSGNIYVADTYNNRIQKFTAEGAFVRKWGTSGSGDRQFNLPFGIAADSIGNIWVADTGNNRVQQFDSNGNFIAKWGSFGTNNGLFKSPTGIASDLSGNIYVTDKDNSRIQKFTNTGTYVSAWGGYGTTDGLFIQVWGIAVDMMGNVYVADRDNHRIQKFACPQTQSRIIALSGNMAFGNVYVNTGIQRTLTISNTGNSALSVSSIVYPTGFTGNWNGTIAAGAYQNVTVTFTPTTAQIYSGTIVINSNKTSGTETLSISGTGIPSQTGISAIRSAPSCYLAGNKLTVSLTVYPTSNTGLYAVEDKQPSGWAVSNISNDGMYDSVSGKIKFGPFFDNTERTLSYDLTPPIGDGGDKSFNGMVSADGVNVTVIGNSVISSCSNHPADINPNDFTLNIGEVTAYGLAWKNGTTWTVPPNPIPISYVTRAGALWQGGESYKFDSTAGEAPMCWVNTSASRSVRDSEAFAMRQISESYQNEKSIRIDITPPSDVRAYAVEDQPPAGWEVISVDSNGQFDPANHKVRFGMFLDNQPRTLSYRVRASSADVSDFSGVASFNGKNIPILSKREPCDNDPNLQDVIVVLQVLSGITPAELCFAEQDMNNDQKLGLDDAVYLLQIIAGLR